MPNRDILADWPGRRDKTLKTATVPAKTGRMVCLVITDLFATVMSQRNVSPCEFWPQLISNRSLFHHEDFMEGVRHALRCAT